MSSGQKTAAQGSVKEACIQGSVLQGRMAPAVVFRCWGCSVLALLRRSCRYIPAAPKTMHQKSPYGRARAPFFGSVLKILGSVLKSLGLLGAPPRADCQNRPLRALIPDEGAPTAKTRPLRAVSPEGGARKHVAARRACARRVPGWRRAAAWLVCAACLSGGPGRQAARTGRAAARRVPGWRRAQARRGPTRFCAPSSGVRAR